MQAFGWMALTGLRDGILCTPGTHTKWLTIENGAITNILTGVTGETFEVLNTHSMLTRGADTTSHETGEFERGLQAMQRSPRPALTQMLMSARNLQLSGDITAARSADYLSGLLTGEDCAAAIGILPAGPIHIIGDGHAVNRYARAIDFMGREVETHDGQACVIAGLQSVRSLG
jgi:2-dehydro-3-deoxygalactonokinase